MAQTLAGAAYLPTSFFASEGDPFGHPYLLRVSIWPFGPWLLFFTRASISTFHLLCFFSCLLSGSLPFRSAPDWTHSPALPPHHFFFNLFPFACSFALRKLWAPCHLGQPPLFSILYLPLAAKGSLPFRSVPLVASFILHCCLLDFSTLALGSLPFRSVPTASR